MEKPLKRIIPGKGREDPGDIRIRERTRDDTAEGIG